METITITIDTLEVEYVPILTNAIRDYDYSYVIDLCNAYSTNFEQSARLILIPVESEKYQRDRYGSGLFFSERAIYTPLSAYTKSNITEELWKRFHMLSSVEKEKETTHANHKD